MSKNALHQYVLSALLIGLTSSRAASQQPVELPPEVALRKASVDGKYVMLLRMIKAPNDVKKHGACHVAGFRAEHADVPAAFWVYVYPHWYLWDERAADAAGRDRRWGPEQATGPPDTKQAGDLPTSWASKTADTQDEWLTLEHEHAVVPTQVVIHETYHPGAVSRVTVFRLTGEEVEVWKGTDPTPTSEEQGVSRIPINVDFKTKRIRIYVSSTTVPGWNEIDAVGLCSTSHGTQWARAAHASSTYAAPRKRNSREGDR